MACGSSTVQTWRTRTLRAGEITRPEGLQYDGDNLRVGIASRSVAIQSDCFTKAGLPLTHLLPRTYSFAGGCRFSCYKKPNTESLEGGLAVQIDV